MFDYPHTDSIHSAHPALSPWLLLLWNIAPQLIVSGEKTAIREDNIFLPASGSLLLQAARVAHAAAHRVYSPSRFEGKGLGPVVRALVGVLEDARAEALAIRQFPGLVRLWRPLHTVNPDSGSSFEILMLRLARSLIDPHYEDPDRWVRKGRFLCYPAGCPDFLMSQNESPYFLSQSANEMGALAMTLGHDVGQMRLAFNIKTYCPGPDYRDDNQWMWYNDVLSAQATPPPDMRLKDSDFHSDSSNLDEGTVYYYREWDRLIATHRQDWCRVIEKDATMDEPQQMILSVKALSPLVSALVKVLKVKDRRLKPRLQEAGEQWDLSALIDWRVTQEIAPYLQPRVYRHWKKTKIDVAVYLLIDQSASTALSGVGSSETLLQKASQAAVACGLAFERSHISYAMSAIQSYGRQRVILQRIKSMDQSLVTEGLRRLQGLTAGGSTRLGAALRHAIAQLGSSAPAYKWIFLFSDGQPHDIDVFDSRYLMEDTQQALQEAEQKGIKVGCFIFPPGRLEEARGIMGASQVHFVNEIYDLPRAVHRFIGSGISKSQIS